MELDLLAHEARVRGWAVHLSSTEFRLLAYLCQNRDRVVGHQELLDRVWGELGGLLDSLKWHIHSLRNKMEKDLQDPRLIVTISGVGYRYRPADSPDSLAGGPAELS